VQQLYIGQRRQRFAVSEPEISNFYGGGTADRQAKRETSRGPILEIRRLMTVETGRLPSPFPRRGKLSSAGRQSSALAADDINTA